MALSCLDHLGHANPTRCQLRQWFVDVETNEPAPITAKEKMRLDPAVTNWEDRFSRWFLTLHPRPQSP